MILYNILSILMGVFLIYTTIGMYKDKIIKASISMDILSVMLIVIGILGFIVEEEYYKYLIFSMLFIVIALVFIYLFTLKKTKKQGK